MSKVEDVVWRMERQSREMQNQRASIRNLWDDDAARDLNMRYLNPHAGDAEVMGRSLRSQDESLNVADHHHGAAVEHGRHAREFAEQVQQFLDLSQEQESRAHAYYDKYIELSGQAAALLPKIAQKIAQANHAC